MTTASLVSPQARIVQLHSNGPAGKVSRSSIPTMYRLSDPRAAAGALARGREIDVGVGECLDELARQPRDVGHVRVVEVVGGVALLVVAARIGCPEEQV